MKPRTPRHQTPDQDIGRLLAVTPLLDYGSATVQRLVADRAWQQLDPTARIGAAYDYVRNEIPFGYNAEDNVAASAVLADGYGQCNTKATLLMALLRAAGIPCRFHAATIHKRLQRGVLTGPTPSNGHESIGRATTPKSRWPESNATGASTTTLTATTGRPAPACPASGASCSASCCATR